jgi:hypothetical protein
MKSSTFNTPPFLDLGTKQQSSRQLQEYTLKPQSPYLTFNDKVRISTFGTTCICMTDDHSGEVIAPGTNLHHKR